MARGPRDWDEPGHGLKAKALTDVPDVEGHPIVAKLGRLAGSPTPPSPTKAQHLHSSVASTLLPGEGDEEKCKEGSRAEPYARPEVFKRGDGRAPGGRKRLARAPGGRKRLAESADFLPNLCVFVVYIYMYVNVCFQGGAPQPL